MKELTHQVSTLLKDKENFSRNMERIKSEFEMRLSELERTRARAEDDAATWQIKIGVIREEMEQLVGQWT